jgi:hypothetical protein
MHSMILVGTPKIVNVPYKNIKYLHWSKYEQAYTNPQAILQKHSSDTIF